MIRLLALLAAILIAASPLPAPRAASDLSRGQPGVPDSLPQSSVSPVRSVSEHADTGTGTPSPAAVSPVAHPSLSATGKRPGSEAQPTAKPSAASSLRGIASTYGPGWDGWIAWPGGPGVRLRVCGHGGCRVVTSNDSGPDKAMQRLGRVVDLDVRTFEATCGYSWRRGLCWVNVEVVR